MKKHIRAALAKKKIPTAPPPQAPAPPRDLTLFEFIIEVAERARTRRVALALKMKAALSSHDRVQINRLARAWVGMEHIA